MNHICSRCKLTSPDGNLWCQEIDCPVGTLPTLFNYGDYIGNIKILELKRVLPSATIYKAQRGTEDKPETFYLKIANPRDADIAYLQREAQALRSITTSRKSVSALPQWLDHGAVNQDDAYGIGTIHGQTRYYFLMGAPDGQFLSDMLLDNPQPWHQHVGWFIMTLCEGIIALQMLTQSLHLNLNPDVILVHPNNTDVPLPVLLDFGVLLPAANEPLPVTYTQDYLHHLKPAYTPAELIAGGQPLDARADVFSIGVILYEMLAGKPAFSYALRKTDDIYNDIKLINPVLSREDLPAKRLRGRDREQYLRLLDIVERAVRRDHPERYHDVSELRRDLFTLYGEVEDKRRINIDALIQNAGRTVVLVGLALFVAFVVIVLATAITT